MLETDNHTSWSNCRKLEFLRETTTPEFHKKTLVDELVKHMSEEEFSIAYNRICQLYDLPRDYQEQEQQIDKLPFGIK